MNSLLVILDQILLAQDFQLFEIDQKIAAKIGLVRVGTTTLTLTLTTYRPIFDHLTCTEEKVVQRQVVQLLFGYLKLIARYEHNSRVLSIYI